ncbi:GNAT family N-acetyltransferase [Photobacterium aquae]|uniref:GNAT family N-acetyltransferase n=1 Tax=Photobacterium aquae TaxID=1195763 RepID=UPI000A073841|nr:GNAT family protein [Photobacterium aquae]
MGLKAFTENDYWQLTEWIDSDELNVLWSGSTFQYPLTFRQLDLHYSKKEVIPFLFTVDGQHAGFIELFKVSDTSYRLCRVFIAEDYRGQQHSKQMITTAIHYAQSKLSATDITLNVFAHNTPALRCYRKLGFVEYQAESPNKTKPRTPNRWQPITMRWQN